MYELTILFGTLLIVVLPLVSALVILRLFKKKGENDGI
jgi:hypothetical protein